MRRLARTAEDAQILDVAREWAALLVDDRYEEAMASVWFDLPLNGRWSDLTATFVVRQLDQSVVLELDDIHVM